MGRGWPQLLALAGVTIVVTGCSGTRFGDQLARSFSAPTNGGGGTAPAKTALPKPGAAGARPPAITTAPGPTSASTTATASETNGTALPSSRPAKPAAPPQVRPVLAPSQPAPYRVTIRLPAADPAAPAERVTEALRAAGVAFEVETIERMGSGSSGATAPLRLPAPAPR